MNGSWFAVAARPVPTLAEPLGNQLLGAVRATIERLYTQHHYRPPFVLVEQWSTADEEHFACRMQDASVVAAWVREGNGLRLVTEAERPERHARDSEPGAVRIHARPVLHRAGRAARRHGGRFRTEGRAWGALLCCTGSRRAGSCRRLQLGFLNRRIATAAADRRAWRSLSATPTPRRPDNPHSHQRLQFNRLYAECDQAPPRNAGVPAALRIKSSALAGGGRHV